MTYDGLAKQVSLHVNMLMSFMKRKPVHQYGVIIYTSAMGAASQLPGGESNDVDDAPAPPS